MKKMRKLVPAFAMLMVAAIMMSTASFAWFTMNEQVTATGMNIQAQASGSLLIKANAKLNETDTKINIDFQDTADATGYAAVYNLKPITYQEGWKLPNENATVDMYGGLGTGANDKLEAATPVKGTHYAEYVVYLATGGEALTDAKLTATITAATNGHLYIAPAYSVAFYINDAETPAAVAHLDDPDYTTDDGCNVKEISAKINIPSVVGVVSGSEGVGVKVTMRVFVDGDLTNPEKMTYRKAVYTQQVAGTKYDETLKYFDDAEGKTETNVTGFVNGETSVEGKYVRSFVTETVENTKYVNSSNVPVAGTTLKVAFKAE